MAEEDQGRRETERLGSLGGWEGKAREGTRESSMRRVLTPCDDRPTLQRRPAASATTSTTPARTYQITKRGTLVLDSATSSRVSTCPPRSTVSGIDFASVR